MYTPEDHQKHVGHARMMSYQRRICFLCITWLPVEGAGQSRATRLPCAASALKASAGHTRAVRRALEQQAMTMLCLQLNLGALKNDILFLVMSGGVSHDARL